MFNLDFQNYFPNTRVTHLPRIFSDHSPMCFEFQVQDRKRPSGFIFQKMWLDHPSFMQMVAQNWTTPLTGSPGHVLAHKLRRLRGALKDWNWNVFGNIHHKKTALQTKVYELEQQLSRQWADDTHHAWKNRKTQILQVEKWETDLICHQARMNWLKDGDRNSIFFHAVIKEKQKRQTLQIALPNGDITTTAADIGAIAQEYFAELFSASPYHMEASLFNSIEETVHDGDNAEFCRVPDTGEILSATKLMNAHSSRGNDGYTGHFFVYCWDIIKSDVCAFVEDFFMGAYIPKEISSTTLVLIPKIEHARNIGNFRPISLDNFNGKIISKILAIRLAKILPTIVNEEQAGFVQGRLISTHIVLAQELIRDINRKDTGGNVAFKVDMAKAYDRLEWRFLLRAMDAFGFSAQSRDLIYRNICHIWYSFRINGEYHGSFRSFRGVRQGDPLSPLLFVLAQQILSVNLKRRTPQLIKPYHIGRQVKQVTHLFYADDVILFTNGARSSLHNLMSLIRDYEASSGQKINSHKSDFYLGRRATHRAQAVSTITGFGQKQLPLTYLGVPIFNGKMKVVFFEHIIEKIRRKLAGWNARLLSFVGRITLIKAVLSNIPIYTLANSLMPKGVLRRIDSHLANFLWNAQGERRAHWVKWASICTPIEEGGLGIETFEQLCQGLHAKLMWLVLENNSLWARYARSKYFQNSEPKNNPQASPLWTSIMAHYQTLS